MVNKSEVVPILKNEIKKETDERPQYSDGEFTQLQMTTCVVQVLHPADIDAANMSLADLAHEAINGDCSVKFQSRNTVNLPDVMAYAACTNQDSDPDFLFCGNQAPVEDFLDKSGVDGPDLYAIADTACQMAGYPKEVQDLLFAVQGLVNDFKTGACYETMNPYTRDSVKTALLVMHNLASTARVDISELAQDKYAFTDQMLAADTVFGDAIDVLQAMTAYDEVAQQALLAEDALASKSGPSL